jgi:hypothetical protein
VPNDAAARRADSAELPRQLERDPRPLLFGPGRLGIIWSAKAACTTLLLWYLWRCDLLEAARAYHAWPHQFRQRKLYATDTHRAWTAEVSASGWSWLRVVRDPFMRAVSSYHHALRYGYEDRKMAQVLRRPIDSKGGYSFEQFLDYLLRIDITRCNLHHRQQVHPVEALIAPTQIVNIQRQDLMACLRKIDETLPPPPQPAAVLDAAIAEIAATHHVREASEGDDCAAVTFTTAQAWSAWPSHRHFLNASTRDKIATIYAADLARYADCF